MKGPSLHPCSYIGHIEPFHTKQIGWRGKEPMGSDYMEQIEERTRRLKTACRDKDQSTDIRQQRLPGI